MERPLRTVTTYFYTGGWVARMDETEQPSCMIIIDNRFEQQRVLIERTKDVFAPSTIARMMEQTIGKWLTLNYRVGMKMRLVYKKDQFWNVIEEFGYRVKKLVFDFPYPNMARPMDKLAASLKQFGVNLKGKVRVVTTAQPRDFLFYLIVLRFTFLR